MKYTISYRDEFVPEQEEIEANTPEEALKIAMKGAWMPINDLYNEYLHITDENGQDIEF